MLKMSHSKVFLSFLVSLVLLTSRGTEATRYYFDFVNDMEGWNTYRNSWHWSNRAGLTNPVPASSTDGFAIMDATYNSDELYTPYFTITDGGVFTLKFFLRSRYIGSNSMFVDIYKGGSHFSRLMDLTSYSTPAANKWITVSANINPSAEDITLAVFCYNNEAAPAGQLMYGCAIDQIIIDINGGETSAPPTTTELITTAAPTEPPTTEAPTEPPTTEAPTEPPTTEAPTEPPTTEAPTEPPTTEAPTEPPTTEAPTEPPTTEAPTEPPTTEAPTEPPTTEAPTELSSTEAPTEPPSTESSTESITTVATTESSTTETPTEPLTTEAPTELPTTDAPTTDAPTEAHTDTSTTDVLTEAPTDAPTTGVPTEATTVAPTTEGTTELPITEASTKAPTTEAPTESITTEEPTDAPTEVTTGLTTTEVPQGPLVFDFQEGTQGWTLTNMNGATWQRVQFNNSGTVVAKPPYGPWVLQVFSSEVFSSTVVAQSPQLEALADTMNVKITFWMDGSRSIPSTLKIRRRNSFSSFDNSPIMNLDPFGDQENHNWITFSANLKNLVVGETFSLILEGSLGADNNNSVAVDCIVLDGVKSIPADPSAFFDFENDLMGWMQSNMDGGRWVLMNWTTVDPSYRIPQPADGGRFLFAERFDIHSGVIALESPGFAVLPGERKKVHIKFWARGSVVYPASLRLRKKSINGVYDSLPFLNLAPYGDIDNADWITLDKQYYIPLDEKDEAFQLVIEADLGSGKENMIAVDNIRVITEYIGV